MLRECYSRKELNGINILAFDTPRHQTHGRITLMEPNQSDTDHIRSHLNSDGDSVPWTPQDIIAEARADARQGVRMSVPFVVQSGPSILMVESGEAGWTLAQLHFDPEGCVYQEMSRVTYTWPREAFGAMLSRLAAHELDEEDVTHLTDEFSAWLGARFARRSCGDTVSC